MFRSVFFIPKIFTFTLRRFGSRIMDKPSVLVTRCDFAPQVLEELKLK